MTDLHSDSVVRRLLQEKDQEIDTLRRQLEEEMAQQADLRRKLVDSGADLAIEKGNIPASRYEVWMTGYESARTIAVIKRLRELFPDLGLAQAKHITDMASPETPWRLFWTRYEYNARAKRDDLERHYIHGEVRHILNGKTEIPPDTPSRAGLLMGEDSG